jgi:murein DD-endopeptidase MepM/ murein hydrolase activator NlpD
MALLTRRVFVVALLVGVALSVSHPLAHADETADNLQQSINALKNEIDQLKIQLNNTVNQKNTLQNAIKQLDLQIQTFTKSISLTNAQISQKDKEIKGLNGNITTTAGQIGQSQSGIAETLRTLQEADNEPMMVAVLGGGSLSAFFDQQITLGTVRDELTNRVEDLSKLKSNLVNTKDVAVGKRKELATLHANLSSQKQSLASARASQNTLLAQTKNQESSYQALIREKQAQEAKFEQDLLTYQKSLGLSVDVGSLPGVRSGVLQWPVRSVRITQYFGNTDFSTKNPQIYNGKGHTGMDFAASPGTPILAALDGTVLGTGNTDTTCPNASFGKWVFVKHNNGLSTLYAHLSTISVTSGQHVGTGDTVGYSGSTGYATGPHLHFGVYASSGSKIATFPSSSCKGKSYTMPVGDVTAYLNPMSYLPAL